MKDPGAAPVTQNTDEVQEWHRQVPDSQGDVYILGGEDLEMSRIRKRLIKAGAKIVDIGMSWEQAANEGVMAVAEQIDAIKAEGRTPVTIELAGAGDLRPDVVEIDHHNERSDRPPSIQQVMERMGLAPVLKDRLVGANDAGYIPAMREVTSDILSKLEKRLAEVSGITEEEKQKRLEGSKRWLDFMIDRVRREDRAAQGVTEEMEREAETAIENAEIDPDTGMVTVRITGDRCSPVTDRLFSKWPGGRQNLIVVASSGQDMQEVWFFGQGDQCVEISDHFLAKKVQKEADGTKVGNEYHSFSGGAGRGKKEADGMALVVVQDPEEVLSFIREIKSEG